MKVGDIALFTYPDFGTPVGYPQHAAHSGQLVTLLCEEEPDEESAERVFMVRAMDGWEGLVMETELATAERTK